MIYKGEQSLLRSAEKQRRLTAQDLRLVREALVEVPESEPETDTSIASDALVEEDSVSLIPDDDPFWARTQTLLDDGYAGVIFVGPPGTGKSWYAEQISLRLVEFDRSRFSRVQFHPSYQYEDFIEGYVPKAGAGFEIVDKHFLQMCRLAESHPGQYCVLMIDELSRTDAARVFGEALTYLEMDKRERVFQLSSGRSTSVPKNLVILATMNLFDRGVDELDLAFERRFGKIAVDPDPAKLEEILIRNGLNDRLLESVLKFFRRLQQNHNPFCRIGHGYFARVVDEPSLRRLWDHQLRFYMKRILDLEPESLQDLEREWESIFRTTPTPPSTE